MTQKVLVINGSPRKDGNTSMMADAFIDGAISTGNEAKRIDVGFMDIGGCKGCNYCLANEGECCQKDDMQDLYPLLREYDVWVYATPIYYFSFPAQFKAFMDRMFCGIANPFGKKKTMLLTVFEDKDETISKPLVDTYKIGSAYAGYENLGVLTINNCFEKGAIAGNPKLDVAREMGAAIV